jgi:hypothetical protein
VITNTLDLMIWPTEHSFVREIDPRRVREAKLADPNLIVAAVRSIKHNVVCTLLHYFFHLNALSRLTLLIFFSLMATLGYPHHDNGFGFGRAPSLSRRPSHHSAYGGKPQVAFPYGDQHAGLQGEVGVIFILLHIIIAVVISLMFLRSQPYHQSSYPVYPQSDRRSRHMPGKYLPGQDICY